MMKNSFSGYVEKRSFPLCGLFCMTFFLYLSNFSVFSVTVDICKGDSKELAASNGDSYLWTPGGETTQKITVNPTTNTTYTCVITNNTGAGTNMLDATIAGFEFLAAAWTGNTTISGIEYQVYNFEQNHYSNLGVGKVTVVNDAKDAKPTHFANCSPQEGSQLLACDSRGGEVFAARNLKLTPGTTYKFSVWIANIDKSYSSSDPSRPLPKIQLQIDANGGGTSCAPTITGAIGIWQKLECDFTYPSDRQPNGWCHIFIRNSEGDPAGNDFALDDVFFGVLSGSTTTTETFDVKVNPLPTISVNSETICKNDNVTLTATGASTYEWSTGETASSINVSPNVTTTYSVKGTDGKGCKNTKSATVTVVDCTDLTLIKTSDGPVCSNDEITFTIKLSNNTSVTANNIRVTDILPSQFTYTASSSTSYDASTGVWNVGNLSPNETKILEIKTEATIAGTNIASRAYVSSVDGNDYADYASAPAGMKSEDITSVTESPKLTLDAWPEFVCKGNSVSLPIIVSGGGNIYWYADDVEITSLRNQKSATLNPQESTTYKVEVADGTCTTEKSQEITVNTLDVEISPANMEICEGDEVTFKIIDVSGTNPVSEITHDITWTKESAFFSNNVQIKDYPTQNTVYAALVEYGGCSSLLSASVLVSSGPEIISITKEDYNSALVMVGNGTPPYLYSIDGDKNYSEDNYFTGLKVGQHIISVKDDNGCIADSTFNIREMPLLFPAFFTPNSDGLNDHWDIGNLELYSDIELIIYDRFGKELLKVKDPTAKAWDGIYLGKQMPSTDYWYRLLVRDIDKEFVGHFTLLRTK